MTSFNVVLPLTTEFADTIILPLIMALSNTQVSS